MKVAIDAQLTVGTATGIGEYLFGLLPALQQQGLAVDVLRCQGYDPWRFDRRLIWDQLLLPARAWQAELLHCTAGTMPLLHRQPIVVTVHDVAWLRVQAHARWYARKYFGAWMLQRYRQAQKIIVVSEFSRRELLDLSDIDPERVVVVHNGVDEVFRQVIRRPDPQQLTLLAVGTIEARKNLATLIEVLARLENRTVQLWAPGPPTPYRAMCEALALRLGVAERVKFLGYVDRAALLGLYERATCAVLASSYEGFGYGAAQALVAGIPLVASNESALPEIVGMGSTLIPPFAIDEWIEVLNRMLAQPQLYENQAAALRQSAIHRFDWQIAARKTREVYASCS